jgi:hypothetical protein
MARINSQTFDGASWTGYEPIVTYGVRFRDPSIRAVQDRTPLKLLARCDLINIIYDIFGTVASHRNPCVS